MKNGCNDYKQAGAAKATRMFESADKSKCQAMGVHEPSSSRAVIDFGRGFDSRRLDQPSPSL